MFILRFLRLIIVLSLFLPIQVAAQETIATPEDFGYMSTPVLGERPLLTIMLEWTDLKFQPEHTPAFYRKKYFGDGFPAVTPNYFGRGGFFDQNSNGLFRFTNAGIIGPLTYPDNPASPGNEASWDCFQDTPASCIYSDGIPVRDFAVAISLAYQNGFNFSTFDRNRNGTITVDELTVLVIVANSRGEDHLTTSNPAWAGRPGGQNGYYSFVRLEGYIYPPGSPPSTTSRTVQMHQWYSWNRDDNFVTTDPRWGGRSGDIRSVHYRYGRSEGYVFSPDAPAPTGTIPLYSWYSPSRRDNFMTSDPAWAGRIGDARTPDYRLFRKEGYIFPPDAPQPPGTIPFYSWYADIGDDGGVTRPTSPGRVPAGSVSVEVDASSVGEYTNADTTIHEVFHTLGAADVYGASCNNTGYTIMACPVGFSEGLDTLHIDPYHKMKLGWLKPQIRTVTGRGIASLAGAGLPGPDINKAILVYDPARGKREYFLLEHRFRQSRFPSPIPPGFTGLYSWWSPSREDNFATSDPNWTARYGDRQSPDYEFFRLEGLLEKEPGVGKVPLYTWWGRSWGDNFATTNPVWAGRAGDIRTGYGFVRIDGYVYSPDAPQPPNTLPLYSWYSPGRGDNFITTDPRWAGRAGDTRPPDYRFVRMEGYVREGWFPNTGDLAPVYSWWNQTRSDFFSTTQPDWAGNRGDTNASGYTFVRTEGFAFSPARPQPAGTIPLYLWWSPSRRDNFTTTNPLWAGRLGDTRPPDYQFVRLEGYVYSPDSSPPPDTARLVSFWNLSDGDNLLSTITATSSPDDLRTLFTGLSRLGVGDLSRPEELAFVRTEGYLLSGIEYNYDGDPWRTGAIPLPDNGLAIWYVQVDGAKNLIAVPSLTVPGAMDGSLYLFPPSGQFGQPAGNGLWSMSSGQATPRWLDGTLSGFGVRVVSSSVDQPHIGIRLGP